MINQIQRIIDINWNNYKEDLFPKDRRMQFLKECNIHPRFAEMSSENISFLINELIRIYASNGTCVQVGIYRGFTLLSAALFNEQCKCIGIDNFNFLNGDGDGESGLINSLNHFNNPKNIEYINENFEDVIDNFKIEEKIDLYLYDGPHDFENQIKGLELIMPYLSDTCLLLVDDIANDDCSEAEIANVEFLNTHNEFKSLFRIKQSESKGDQMHWHRGFEVMGRNI